jgi:hypothetical protein
MLEWILLAVTTVSVVFLWRHVGKIGQEVEFLRQFTDELGKKMEQQSRDLALLRGELVSLQQDRK